MPFLVLYVQFLDLSDRAAGRLRRGDRDSGQGALEYVGMLLLVAGIVFALSSTHIGEQLVGKVSDAIKKAFSG